MNDFSKWKLLKIEYPVSLSVFPIVCCVKKKEYQTFKIPLDLPFENFLGQKKEPTTPPSKPSNVISLKNHIENEVIPALEPIDKSIVTEESPTPEEDIKTSKPVTTPDLKNTNWFPIIAGVGLLIALLLAGIFWNGVKSNSEEVLRNEKLRMELDAKRKSALISEIQEKIDKLEQLEARSKEQADRLNQLKEENIRLSEEKLKKERILAQLEARENEKEKQNALRREQKLEEENALLEEKRIEYEKRIARLKEERRQEQRQKEARQAELRKKELEELRREEKAEMNRCVDGRRLSAGKIRGLVSGKTAYGIKVSKKGNRLYAWKEYQSKGNNSGTAYFQREWKKNEKGRTGKWKKYITGKWKLEERSGSDVICWCYGSCKSYDCSYVESHNNCSYWTYTKLKTGDVKKISRWFNGDKTE